MRYLVQPGPDQGKAYCFPHIENDFSAAAPGTPLSLAVIYEDSELLNKSTEWYAFRIDGHPTIKCIHVMARYVTEVT